MAMTNAIQIFDYKSNKVRTVEQDGQVWFVAKDVCDILELKNVTDSLKSLDDDEKMTLGFSESHSGKRGGAQSINVISESGLYTLIMRSRKPEARRFRKWVTNEVLPSIMRTGSYTANLDDMSADEAVAWHAKKHTQKAIVPVVNELTKRGRKMTPIPQGHFKAATKIIYAALNGDAIEALALDEIFKSYTGFSALSTGKIINEVERVKWLEEIRDFGILRDRHEKKYPEYYTIDIDSGIQQTC